MIRRCCPRKWHATIQFIRARSDRIHCNLISNMCFPKTSPEFFAKVGKTPLVLLKSISRSIGRNIYVKLEYHNPTGSVKDRAAVKLLQDSIERGLKPGGTLVEATAGNTGISLAVLSRLAGYKLVLFVPETLIQAKIDKLTGLGAEVFKAENYPDNHPKHMNSLAAIYAKEHDNTIHVNQMNNLVNQQAHYETTGPEIWKQLEGSVDAFVAGAGTGGTFSGVSKYLKEVSDGRVKTIIADRQGSGLHHYIQTNGESFDAEGESFVEGIGKLGLVDNIKDVLNLANDSLQISDIEALNTIYRLIDEEDLRVGASAGVYVAAAIKVAESLPPGSNVVTVIPDAVDIYAKKVFSKQWLVEQDHWDKIPSEYKKYATL
ncbi:hypothetical protein KL909_002067 [Ogataea angusta]|nr:hypothetical protein KL909_002067 [Ogataea angusta]KAG7833901.1 hypothetical protein KL943_003197 [Ogataea angusta]